MFKKIFQTRLGLIVVSLAIMAVLAPSLAFAHGGDRGNHFGGMNEFGVRVFGDIRSNDSNDDSNDDDEDNDEDNDKDERDERKNERKGHVFGFGRLGGKFMSSMFYSGTVTSISGANIVIDAKGDTDFTVDTSGATVIQLPRTEVSASDIEVGDKVHVTGTRSGTTIDASVIYTLPQNLKPAAAKGTVNSVSDNSLTVQTKADAEVQVNVDGDTEIVDQNHDVVALADVEAGSKVKLFGFWDTVLNVFNAIKIKIWS
jgi:hypothetical protein